MAERAPLKVDTATGRVTQFGATDLIPAANISAEFAQLRVAFGGITVPARSLDRVRGETLPRWSTLNGAINNSVTAVTVTDAQLTRAGVSEVIQIDTEQMLVTAGQGTTSLTVTRAVNNTAAASHSDKASVLTSGVLNIVWCGDSIIAGDQDGQQEGAVEGLRRDLDRRLGGVLGGGFHGLWRSTWAHVGNTAATTSDAWDLGPFAGAYTYAASASNMGTWTRPAWEHVAQIDVLWIDLTAASTNLWSYSTDGGTTWVNNPFTPTNPAAPQLRRTSIVVNDPASFKVRACKADGTTTSALYLVGIDTWSTVPVFGYTTGVKLHNVGWSGNFLSTFARSGSGDWGRLFDGDAASLVPGLVICGTWSNDILFYSLATFAANLTAVYNRVSPYADVVFVNAFEQGGPRGTVPTATPWNSGTTYVFGDYASLSGTNYWCILGHTNHTPPNATYWTACTADITQQANIRAQLSTTAASLKAAVLDYYQAFAAEGLTGFSATDTLGGTVSTGSGLMGIGNGTSYVSGLHPSALGHRDMAARMSRLITWF